MPGHTAQARQWFRVVNLSGDFRNAENPRRAEIAIFEQIGEDFWTGDGVTAGRFIRAIDALGELDEIMLRINSPGGDVMDGLTITNYLLQHPAKVSVRIDGQAASIASVIMMAGEERVMGMGTSVFVHDPISGLIGDADEMRKMADELDTVRDGIIEVYQSRVNLSREELITLMRDDTRMTADEAVTWGFATAMDSDIKAAACADLDKVFNKAREHAAAMVNRSNPISDVETLRAENNTLQQTVADLTQQIDALHRGPEPANPAEVITACAKAGISNMAAGWVEQKLPMEAVTARLERASAIKDLCTAAGEEAEPYLAHLDEPVEALRVAMAAVQAAKDQDIDNTIQPGGEGRGKTGKGTAEIYRARNQNKVLMKR